MSGRGNTDGADGGGRVRVRVDVNEIADAGAATSGRRRRNKTETRTLAAVNVADEDMNDRRAGMTRTTSVHAGQVAHRIPSRTKVPHLINAVALRLSRKTRVWKEKG